MSAHELKFNPATTPVYWMHETTGEMRRIVETYLEIVCNERPSTDLSADDIVVFRDYLKQWIDWPWPGKDFADEIDELRKRVLEIDNVRKAQEWLRRAMDLGIDPL